MSLGSWRTEDMHRFVERIVPVVLAGERQIATLTDLYLTSQLVEMHGIAPPAGGIDLDEVTGAALRNGADPNEVYARPFITLYAALKEGLPLAQAVIQGATRLDSLTATDMQLAKTHTANASLDRSETQFYRRVLVGAKNCALCIVASTQRYRVGKLMPIHPGCNCGIAPAEPNSRHVLNKALLEQVHADVEHFVGESARDGREIDYRELLVDYNHGEYGPTLAWRDHSHTGPDDITS